MNANRRKQLNEIMNMIADLDGLRADIMERLEGIRDDEQDAFDNLPEGIQETDRGDMMQEAIDNMQSALDDLDSIDFEAISDYIAEAQA